MSNKVFIANVQSFFEHTHTHYRVIMVYLVLTKKIFCCICWILDYGTMNKNMNGNITTNYLYTESIVVFSTKFQLPSC